MSEETDVRVSVRGVPTVTLPTCTGSPRALLPSPWLVVVGAPESWCPCTGARGLGRVNCCALPKQCSSMQGLESAFMIYLKFKSVPGPRGRGEGRQLGTRPAQGRRKGSRALFLCQPGSGPCVVCPLGASWVGLEVTLTWAG